MIETLLGGALGGVFRLAPEIVKYFDAKNERKHEKEMLGLNIEADKLRASQQLAQTEAEGQIKLDAGGLEALTEALKGQAAMATAAGGMIASLSASVRPVTTYYLLALYGVAKAATWYILYKASGDLAASLQTIYDAEDRAMLAGVINFWFLDRVIKKR